MKTSTATQEAKERIKQAKKENKEMKNHKTALTVIVSVVATLGVLAAFVATFYAGTQYQQEQHEVIKAEATKLATLSKPNEK